jgi:dihydroneopterin aldolase
MQPDRIKIRGLTVVANIGVPEEERAMPQRLSLNVTLIPRNALTGLGDQIQGTVDYAEVATLCRKLASQRPRRLIETLAEELANSLLAAFPLRTATVEVEKYILPDVASVSTRITKTIP